MNLVYLFIFIVTSFALNQVWRSILSNRFYYFLIVPGMIVHELSHILGCFLVGAKVKEVKLFSKKGGYIVHKKPKLPLLGKIIIALAPIIVGSIISLMISKNLGLSITNFEIEKLVTIKFWVFFIIVTSILIEMIPSKADLKNAIGGFVLITGIGGLLYWLGWSNLFSSFISNPGIEKFLFLMVSLESFLLILSLPFYLIRAIFSHCK